MTDSGRGFDTAVFDVDGTLVDSNYQHAIAWFRAFRRRGIVVPIWRIHRHIGMGGDKLVAALLGDDAEQREGDGVRAAYTEEFTSLLGEVTLLDGAYELLRAVKANGLRLVLASSGKPEFVDHFLDLLDGRSVADAWTSSQDVAETKPAPDLVEVAMGRVDAGRAVVVGDSTWDAVAARRVGVACLAVRSGGFSVEELREAGARAVFDSPRDLLTQLPTAIPPA